MLIASVRVMALAMMMGQVPSGWSYARQHSWGPDQVVEPVKVEHGVTHRRGGLVAVH
jgi:hypothetical protein